MKKSNIDNQGIQSKGWFNKITGKIVYNYGLDEDLVTKLLSDATVTIVEQLKQQGQQISNKATEQICNTVCSKFEDAICDVKQLQSASKQEIREAIQANFQALVSNSEEFNSSFLAELAKQRKQAASLADALDAMSAQQSSAVYDVKLRLDKVDNKLDTIYDGINLLLSSRGSSLPQKFCPQCNKWLNTEATYCPDHKEKLVTHEEYIQQMERKAEEERRKAELARNFQIDGNVLVKYLGSDSIVYIPEGIMRIANYAFKGCKGIVKEVVFPSTLREIECKAFGLRVKGNYDNIDNGCKLKEIRRNFYKRKK